MDTEKSSSSSFEDLSNLTEVEMKGAAQECLKIENSDIESQDRSATLSSEVESSPSYESVEKVEKDSFETAQQDESAAESQTSAMSVGDNDICDILGNGQLVKRIIIKSKSKKRPSRGDLVTINLTGKLVTDGALVEREENFQIHVGDYEVIQGLDMAIPIMNIGEVAEIFVDSRFGYGSIGLKNENNLELSFIPPYAKLVYEVHLLDCKTEDFADLKTYEIRKKYGVSKKERANFWYNRSDYNIAIQLYRRALNYLDDRDDDPGAYLGNEDIQLTNSELQSLLEDRLLVYNNLAMAQIKISAFDSALKAVEIVLRCEPNNPKALYRKGRILEGKGDTKGAISLLQRVASFEPDSKTIQQDLAKLIIKERREEHNEKEMYQKMLGQAKKLEQKVNQKQKHPNIENSKLKLLGYLMGSILIGVAGVAFYRYKY